MHARPMGASIRGRRWEASGMLLLSVSTTKNLGCNGDAGFSYKFASIYENALMLHNHGHRTSQPCG
jgi:hypothetical protein